MNDVKKERDMAIDGMYGPDETQTAPSVNHNQQDSGTGDELVSSVTLYRRRPRLLHGTVLPFLAVLYPGWLYVWLGVYGASEYPEAGLLALAAIGIAHVLTALSGYWSVHAHCWLTCSKVNTSNNNKTYIVYWCVRGTHCFVPQPLFVEVTESACYAINVLLKGTTEEHMCGLNPG